MSSPPFLSCVFCAQFTYDRATLDGHAIALCASCRASKLGASIPLCGTCGQPLRKRKQRTDTMPAPERALEHEQRVVDAILALPHASWRDLVRHTRLFVQHAQAARERLLASGRIVCVAKAAGFKGARYRVTDRPTNDESTR